MKDHLNLAPDELVDLYRMMLRIRKFEDCVRRYHVSGKAPGLVHLCTGQEAVSTGFIAELNREDWITIYHRGHGHCIAKGSPMDKVLGELLHKREGLCGGRTGEPHLCDANVNNIGSTGIVAGNVKEQGIHAIEQHGPYRLHAPGELMKHLDELLQAFVEQHRMKLPGSHYVPCYALVG